MEKLNGPGVREHLPFRKLEKSNVFNWNVRREKRDVLPDGWEAGSLCRSLKKTSLLTLWMWHELRVVSSCMINQSFRAEREEKNRWWFTEIFHNYDSAWIYSSARTVEIELAIQTYVGLHLCETVCCCCCRADRQKTFKGRSVSTYQTKSF